MALQCLGLLFIARAGLMESAAAVELVAAALEPASAPTFKTRVLANLTELLRVRVRRSN